MLIELSYPIGPIVTVIDPALKRQQVTPRSRLADGGHSNTSYIEVFAHAGTHIDAPWHFNDHGRQIMDFSVEEFVFSRVLLVDVPKRAWEPVTLADLIAHKHALNACDALLIRTGFGQERVANPDQYVQATPGLAVDAADFLASLALLRCIGVDCISVENVQRGRETGFPVHHRLLNRSAPMLLLEDANLAALRATPVIRLLLFPLRMVGLEASPVLAVAEV